MRDVGKEGGAAVPSSIKIREGPIHVMELPRAGPIHVMELPRAKPTLGPECSRVGFR
jgi:hypothetical protein